MQAKTPIIPAKTAGERKCLRNIIESNMAKRQKIDLSILEEVTMVSGLIKMSSFLEKSAAVRENGCFADGCGNYKIYHIAKTAKSQDLRQRDTVTVRKNKRGFIFVSICADKNILQQNRERDWVFFKKIVQISDKILIY